MPINALNQLTTRRLRILWIVLGALLLVSVMPLWLYHRQVLRLSEEKLQDTERLQQNEITRSLASETLQFESEPARTAPQPAPASRSHRLDSKCGRARRTPRR